MDVLFTDARLEAAILQDRPHPRLPAELRRHALHRLRLLQAIPDLHTLKSWKSAHFHAGRGRNGVCQIGITGGLHFKVKLDETLSPPAINIVGIGSETARNAA